MLYAPPPPPKTVVTYIACSGVPMSATYVNMSGSYPHVCQHSVRVQWGCKDLSTLSSIGAIKTTILEKERLQRLKYLEDGYLRLSPCTAGLSEKGIPPEEGHEHQPSLYLFSFCLCAHPTDDPTLLHQAPTDLHTDCSMVQLDELWILIQSFCPYRRGVRGLPLVRVLLRSQQAGGSLGGSTPKNKFFFGPYINSFFSFPLVIFEKEQ